jgi:ectoine hydroxylase-related dioxygenase (phytanoyl-CoA dioxygenase family)
VQTWADAFAELVAERSSHPDGLAARGQARFYTTLPWRTPFSDPRVFAHPTVMAIVRRVLGRGPAMVQMAADTPFAGAEMQDLHRDFPPLFADDFITPLYAVAVNFALVDVNEDNSPFAMARGTHVLRRAEAESRVASGEIPIETFPMEMGDVVIRSPLALHRGTPNLTPYPRPMIVMGYVRPWLQTWNVDLTIPRATYQRFTPTVRSMLRCNVVDELVEQPETYVHFKH